MEFESPAKENANDLDNLRNLARLMAPRARHFLHDGWFHPHPVGFGHRYPANPRHPGPKADCLIAETEHMKSIILLGILLAVLGMLALVYEGFSYTRQEEVLDVGPIHATADTQEHIPLTPIAGGLALAAGAVMLAIGAKQKA
jgi:hypothetical protein